MCLLRLPCETTLSAEPRSQLPHSCHCLLSSTSSVQTKRCHRLLHQTWQEQRAALIISLQIATGTSPSVLQLVGQRAVHPSSLTRVSVQNRGSTVSSQLLLWYPGSRPGLNALAGSGQAPNYPESHLVVHLYSRAGYGSLVISRGF